MGVKTVTERQQYVVKGNELIRHTRYNLTAQQQKIVLYIISKIKPEDDIGTQYTFDLIDLARTCGIQIDEGGTYYKRLREDIEALTIGSWVSMIEEDGEQVDKMISWLNPDVYMYRGKGKITVTFNRNLMPYLFELKERYTQYKLQNVLAFKGKYTIRLYEILRSYTTQDKLDRGKETEIDISIKKIKEQLEISEYKKWYDFHRYVIKPSITEINERSEDIHVEYFTMRDESGRTIERINFIISPARTLQKINAHQTRREYLDQGKRGRKKASETKEKTAK